MASAIISSVTHRGLLPWLHPSSSAEIKTCNQTLESHVIFGGISCVPGSNVFVVSDLPQSKEYPAYFVTEVGCLIRLAASPSSLQCSFNWHSGWKCWEPRGPRRSDSSDSALTNTLLEKRCSEGNLRNFPSKVLKRLSQILDINSDMRDFTIKYKRRKR